jgi:hypothetical protein
MLRQLWKGKALQDDLARAEALGFRGYSHDFSNHQATLQIQDKLRISEILAYVIEHGYMEDDEFLQEWWDTAIFPMIQESQRMPGLFGFKIPSVEQGDYSKLCWFIGMLLDKIGLKTSHIRTAGEGRKRSYYVINESLDALRERLLRALALEGFEVRATPLSKVLLDGVAPEEKTPSFEEIHAQYIDALEAGDTELAEKLGRQLDQYDPNPF